MTQAKNKAAPETPADGSKAEVAATQTPDAENKVAADVLAKSNALNMIAINTVGNHKPGDTFTVKDQAAYDRFISLGAAKKV